MSQEIQVTLQAWNGLERDKYADSFILAWKISLGQISDLQISKMVKVGLFYITQFMVIYQQQETNIGQF